MKTNEEKNILKNNELKSVEGGQAVLPLLSNDKKAEGAAKIVGATKLVMCPKCNSAMPRTSGKDVCPVCGWSEY